MLGDLLSSKLRCRSPRPQQKGKHPPVRTSPQEDTSLLKRESSWILMFQNSIQNTLNAQHIFLSSNMVDVTDFVTGINTRKTVFGVTFEQLILVLYPLFLIPAAFLWYRDLQRRRRSATIPTGCVKVGVSGQSHAADEHDAKYDKGTTDEKKWTVKALYIHPIKSCSAIELDVADVDAEGLTYDRKFCFAELITPSKDDEQGKRTPKWTFRTLRQPGYEKLALVKPEVWIPKTDVDGSATGLRQVDREGTLIVKYPNVPTGFFAPLDRLMLDWGLIPKENSFRVPLDPTNGYDKEVLGIWGEDPVWFNMGRHIPEDFKQWMGVSRPLTLFRVDPESHRPVMGSESQQEAAIRAQDAYPVNMLNLASVHDVGNRISKDVMNGLSVRRFRANIIVEGPRKCSRNTYWYCYARDGTSC